MKIEKRWPKGYTIKNKITNAIIINEQAKRKTQVKNIFVEKNGEKDLISKTSKMENAKFSFTPIPNEIHIFRAV